jgi:hypothetical protein
MMLTMRGVAAFALLVGNASALNNGLGRTPPMGFNVRPTLRLLRISCCLHGAAAHPALRWLPVSR